MAKKVLIISRYSYTSNTKTGKYVANLIKLLIKHKYTIDEFHLLDREGDEENLVNDSINSIKLEGFENELTALGNSYYGNMPAGAFHLREMLRVTREIIYGAVANNDYKFIIDTSAIYLKDLFRLPNYIIVQLKSRDGYNGKIYKSHLLNFINKQKLLSSGLANPLKKAPNIIAFSDSRWINKHANKFFILPACDDILKGKPDIRQKLKIINYGKIDLYHKRTDKLTQYAILINESIYIWGRVEKRHKRYASKHVHMHPPFARSELPGIQKRAKFLISFSEREYYPSNLIESLANGTPIIIQNNYKQASWFTNGNKNGLLLKKKRSKNNLVKDIDRFIQMNDIQYAKLCANALSFAQKNFSFSKFEKSWIKALSEIGKSYDKNDLSLKEHYEFLKQRHELWVEANDNNKDSIEEQFENDHEENQSDDLANKINEKSNDQLNDAKPITNGETAEKPIATKTVVSKTKVAKKAPAKKSVTAKKPIVDNFALKTAPVKVASDKDATIKKPNKTLKSSVKKPIKIKNITVEPATTNKKENEEPTKKVVKPVEKSTKSTVANSTLKTAPVKVAPVKGAKIKKPTTTLKSSSVKKPIKIKTTIVERATASEKANVEPTKKVAKSIEKPTKSTVAKKPTTAVQKPAIKKKTTKKVAPKNKK